MSEDLSDNSRSIIDDTAKKQIVEEISNRESLKSEIDQIGRKITVFAMLIAGLLGMDEIGSDHIDLAIIGIILDGFLFGLDVVVISFLGGHSFSLPHAFGWSFTCYSCIFFCLNFVNEFQVNKK